MRRIYLIAGIPAVIIVLLVIAQLVLPGIAATHIRNMLKGHGKVDSVSVSAFPAVELLWHHADHVKIKMDSYNANNTQLIKQLDQVSDVGKLDVSATTVKDGLITVHDATMTKRGKTLTGTGRIEAKELEHALPILKSVKPIASQNGELVLRGTVDLLIFSGTVDAAVEPHNGGIAVVPNLPLLGNLTVQVFSDQKLTVQSIGAHAVKGGFDVTATATLN